MRRFGLLMAVATLVAASIALPMSYVLLVLATSRDDYPNADTLALLFPITVAVLIGSITFIVWVIRADRAAPATAAPSPVIEEGGPSSRVAMLGVLGLSVAGLSWVIVNISAESARSSATPVPPTPLPGWVIPDGFAMSPIDSEVAYRVDEGGRCDRSSCWHMTVITAHGCPNTLSVVVTGGGSGGTTHIGDSVGSVRAGEEAKLVFENDIAGVTDVRIASISCR